MYKEMRAVALFILILFINSCTQTARPKESMDLTKIDELMETQEAAWNSGDLEAFMEPYWNSDSLIFIGKRGPTYGWKQTLENYKKSYPNKEAMGTLQFTNLQIEALGEERALVIGKWELFRTADTLSGHYSLIWAMKNGSLKIIADHSS
jgi:ketosteroid isomerase-like protein